MQTNHHSTFWIKGMLWLLAISFLFTILSRAADSFTVAKVSVCSPTARKIQYSLTANGKVEKNREISVITQPDLLVKSILVNEGERVAAGDVLAVLDMEHIEKSIAEIRDERSILALQNQTARDNQKQERQKQQQMLKRAKADYAWIQKQNQKELQQAKKELETMQKTLQQLKKSHKKTDATKADNEKQERDSITTLQESIADQKKQLAELRKTAHTEELAAKRAIEDAMVTPADDHTTNINNISIRKLDQQIDQLITLQKQKGKILAPADGTITAVLVNIGQKTTDTGIFTMTDEQAGLKYVSQIAPTDASMVSIGDTVSLKKGSLELEVSITSLELDDTQEQMILTALLPAGTYTLGDTVTMSVTQESETYPNTVPLTAVYEDNGKKYILLADKEDTVLGKNEIARKTEVQIIEQNEHYAALEADTLSADSQIITDTDRLVKAGDRIRIQEKQ